MSIWIIIANLSSLSIQLISTLMCEKNYLNGIFFGLPVLIYSSFWLIQKIAKGRIVIDSSKFTLTFRHFCISCYKCKEISTSNYHCYYCLHHGVLLLYLYEPLRAWWQLWTFSSKKCTQTKFMCYFMGLS